MPKKLEHTLELRAKKLHLHGARKKAYIFGTLNKIKMYKKHKL